MALTELLFNISPVEIGVVQLDASVNEIHNHTAEVTEHPVEAEEIEVSNTVTDNIRVKPFQIQIEGIVSNHPASLLGVAQAALSGSFDPAKDAYEEFIAVILTRGLVTVTTSLYQYDNMAFESLSVTRNARYGNALSLNATLKQVRKVSTRTSAQTGGGLATKKLGKKKLVGAAASTSGVGTASTVLGALVGL